MMADKTADRDAIQEAVEKNYEAFRQLLPELMKTKAGQFVLLRDQAVVEVFDTMADAVKFGSEKYPDNLFSVQRIDTSVSDLGYFSHALPVAPVQSDDRAVN